MTGFEDGRGSRRQASSRGWTKQRKTLQEELSQPNCHTDFLPMEIHLGLLISRTIDNSVCCFKPLGIWLHVTVAIGNSYSGHWWIKTIKSQCPGHVVSGPVVSVVESYSVCHSAGGTSVLPIWSMCSLPLAFLIPPAPINSFSSLLEVL